MPTGQEIMVRAGVLLNDEDHTRWPLTELADWINEGVRAIVLAKPSASSTTKVLSLVRGTLQTVPTAGTPTPLQLLDLVRNLLGDGSDRSKGGRVITPVKRQILNAQEPNWHNELYVRFKREVRHLVFDEQNPLQYWVFPGNDATGVVEAMISQLPAKVEASGDVALIGSYAADIGLPEPYSVPLLDYVIFRAQSKDDLGGNAGRATAHYAAFASAVGLKIQVEGATSPNTRRVS